MDLVKCKGLQQNLDKDIDFLERRLKEAESTRQMFRDHMQMQADTMKLLRERIRCKMDALQVLEEYINTLKPSYGQIVRLRMLEGRTWEQIAKETGYNLQHVQVIYKKELMKFPPEVWELFSRKWEEVNSRKQEN